MNHKLRAARSVCGTRPRAQSDCSFSPRGKVSAKRECSPLGAAVLLRTAANCRRVFEGSLGLNWLTDGAALGVNVLGEGQKPLLGHFGKGFAPGEPAFEGLDVKHDKHAATMLLAAHAFLDCRVMQRCEAGDHVLVVCRVIGGSRAERSAAGHTRAKERQALLNGQPRCLRASGDRSRRGHIASPIGTKRGNRHGSCRPSRISVGSPDLVTVF